MAEANRRFPDQAAELSPVFEQIRAQGASPARLPSGEANPHARLTGPAEGEPARAADASASQARTGTPSAATGRSIAGVVDLDPTLRGQVPAGAVLFLIVREARLQKGPPAAVKRLAVTSFPLRFEMSGADSMAGEPLPDPLRLEARLDKDGNPMTRDPDDPTAAQDFVRAGTTDLRLVLKR